MHGFDPAALGPDETGRIVKSCVAPRPLAWISTAGDDGTPNLAPFSCYNYVSPSPPVVMFATSADREDGLKDTPRNILDTGEFAVNVTTEPFLVPMDATSDPLEPGEDEFAHAGVEPAACETISAPRVAGALACLECELHDSMRVYDRLLVMGECGASCSRRRS